MEITPFWSLAPTLVALVVSLVLLGVARRSRWRDPIEAEIPNAEIQVDPTPILIDFNTKFRSFLKTYNRELMFAGVILGVLIYALVSAPVQMTGETPKTPGAPGSPFFFVHWQRNHLLLFYHETATTSNLLTGLFVLGLAVFALIKRSPQKAKTSLLWSCLALAGSAQWMVSGQVQLSLGIAFYLLAAGGFLFWSLINNRDLSADIDGPHSLSKNREVVLVLLILALATFGRMFELKLLPYGIEGDEAKWTAEVVWLGLRGEPDSNGLYHRDALPVSFYMQTIFHRLLGPSLFAARFEVAFFSIFGTFIFYLLLRRIGAMPIALLASWLLSASIFDISASRLANVESHVKIWPLLALALLSWALDKKHWTNYAIAGVALALGLMTYDTVWPLGLVMLIITIIEAIRQKDDFRDGFRNVMAMLTPALLVMPFIVPYMTGRLNYYELDSRGWDKGFEIFWEHFQRVFSSWYVHLSEDFLYNRNGPLLNAFLLPWMTFGFIALLATLRRRLSLWSVIWVLLFIFPVPIVAHSPFGRVYYPALPAIYILVAVGMYVFSRESLRALGRNFQPVVAAVSLAVLIWLPIFNLFIYFNEVFDFADRQMRREVAEMAGEVASEDNLIVLASVPQANEALNNEYQMIELFMMKNLSHEQISDSYKNVALEEILPNLSSMSDRSSRSIILDKQTLNDRQKRDDLTAALRKCYPGAGWLDGVYFYRVDLDADALDNPACISTVLTLEEKSPALFNWELSQGSANRVSMACETLQIDRTWIEAETLNPAPGWQTETSFANGWLGEGFLMDNYNSQPTLFDFEVTEEKPVYIWVRSYKRVVDNSPGFISMNGEAYPFGDIDDEKINEWVWERLGPFHAPTGLNTAAINRPFNDDPSTFMAVFVDVVAATTDEDFSPTADSFSPLPVQSYTFPAEKSEGDIIIQMEPGTYRCTLEAVSREVPIVDSFGKTPVRSNSIEFTIKP
ncbi:MAG: glycosyltransferase family 39 protein [Anaerolineales bacterium]|nr:glycosyltransferase family 39 protein [Anaerolineales bacterium]